MVPLFSSLRTRFWADCHCFEQLCVEYKESNNNEITSSAEKVVRPWPDRPDRRLRPWSLIGSRICSFGWHQGRWPWMTLNCYMLEFSRKFARFRRWEPTTARPIRMKIAPYCQRQNFIPLNVGLCPIFQRCIDYVDIAGRSSARGPGVKQGWDVEN